MCRFLSMGSLGFRIGWIAGKSTANCKWDNIYY
jgi:hypothetical protein